MTVRIVIRRYAGDQQEHAYRVEQLLEADWEFAVPLCREFPYRHLHPRGMVSHDDLPAFGGAFDRCASCSVWARQHQHTVVVRGTVGA